MKRVILVAAAACGIAGVFGAAPVKADAGQDATVTSAAIDIANEVLKDLPPPQGWKNRHVCVWVDAIDRSWCVFFPFPT